VTDRTDLEAQLRETAGLSGEAVRPTDIDKRSRESATALTQRVLAERAPDIVFAMLQEYQDKDKQSVGGEKLAMTILRKEKRPGK
jgi:type I restriction enzyme, R subunit